jgi:hypothetical protein
MLHLLTSANGTKRRKPRRRVYVSFWESSGSAWTDGLGCRRRKCPLQFFARKGGLVSYGIETAYIFRRSASYVDRILRGTKPSDLPVQAPNKFELVINLKTAKAFGLTVPLIMQMTADEVIE